MFTQDKGCIRLFRLAGITVFLHWSWFLVAFLELKLRRDKYDSLAWLDPAMQHVNQALASIRQGAFAEAVAECDLALKLIPQGHTLRNNVDSCRALALAKLSESTAAPLEE